MTTILIILVGILLVGVLLVIYKKKSALKNINKAKELLKEGNLEESLALAAAAFSLPIGKLSPQQGSVLYESLKIIETIMEKESLQPGEDLKTLHGLLEKQGESAIEIEDKLYERLEGWISDLELSDDPLSFIRKNLPPGQDGSQGISGEMTEDTPSVPDHLSVIGNTSSASLEVSSVQTADGSQEIPFACACFPPDDTYDYYRYVSCWLGRTLENAHASMSEKHLFDLCVCSETEDTSAIGDMYNLTQHLINRNVYISEYPLFVSLPGNNGNKKFLLFPYSGIADSLQYKEREIRLFTLVPISDEEYEWIQETNDTYDSSIGTRVLREWLEYRGHAPLGTKNGPSLFPKDKEAMDKMAEEIAAHMEKGGDNWFSDNPDPDYGAVFQAFVARYGGNSFDRDIQEAGALIISGQYDKAIGFYKELIRKNPKEVSTYEDQIGVAYFFKKEYHKALEHYLESAKTPSDHNDYNFWEVCELLFQQEKDSKYPNLYLEHYPKGEHVQDAKKLLE